MVKTLTGLLPLALGVGVAGIVIWLLLSRSLAIGRWLLAAFLVGHGWVHMLYVIPRPGTPRPRPLGSSGRSTWRDRGFSRASGSTAGSFG